MKKIFLFFIIILQLYSFSVFKGLGFEYKYITIPQYNLTTKNNIDIFIRFKGVKQPFDLYYKVGSNLTVFNNNAKYSSYYTELGPIYNINKNNSIYLLLKIAESNLEYYNAGGTFGFDLGYEFNYYRLGLGIKAERNWIYVEDKGFTPMNVLGSYIIYNF